MRRVPLSLVMLVAITAMAATPQTAAAQNAAAAAQTAPAQPAPFFRPGDPAAIFGPAVTTTTLNPDIVVARLMTFDFDNDGRLVKSELPERMQNLLVADASGDQALDRDEIRALARPAAPAVFAATAPGFRGGGGGYTFGDQVSLSTREHVEGALDDLRLTPIAHQQALAIVRPFMARLEADATTVLLNELEGLMAERQLNSFRAMLDRQLSGNGVQMVTQRNGMRVNVFRFGPDLTMLINGFALPPEQTKAALAAFDRFKTRIRPADADRAVLLAELKDVLNDEERDNFGAALQRRPLVKAGGGVVAGVVGGFVPPLPPPPPGTLIDGPAVLRLPFTPERQVLTP
jgi:hypothetical protein